MSRASQARAKRRAAKRVGAVMVDSVSITRGAIDEAERRGAERMDFIAFHIANAINRLDDAGGDVEAHTVITIGEHPDHPGELTIEAKVSKLKTARAVPVDERDDAGQ